MFGQFRIQNLVLLMASVGMVAASTEDGTPNPAWKQIAESGPIVEETLNGIEESGM